MVKEFKQIFLLRRDTPHTSVHDVYVKGTSLVAQMVKNLPSADVFCNAEGTDSIPELGGSFEEGNGYPLLYSCLEIAWTEVYEKVLSISNHQGNANQNYNEISLCTCQYDNYQTDKQQTITCVGKAMEEMESLYTISGNVKWYNHYGR